MAFVNITICNDENNDKKVSGKVFGKLRQIPLKLVTVPYAIHKLSR